MDRMCIYRPCCLSINWIIEDARMKAEEDAMYGQTEVVNRLSFHQRTVSGVDD